MTGEELLDKTKSKNDQIEKLEYGKAPKSNFYILMAFGSACLFSMSLELKAIMTKEVGTQTLFYATPGMVFGGIIFNIYHWRKSVVSGTSFDGFGFSDENGNLNIKVIKLFSFFCVSFMASLWFVILTIQASQEVKINPGLITSLWCIMPFFSATTDYLAFGLPLKKSQAIGILVIVIATIILGMKDIISAELGLKTNKKQDISNEKSLLKPICLSILTCLTFTMNGFISKYMAARHNYSPQKLVFNSMIVTNFIIFLVGVTYWKHYNVEIKPFIFVLGFFQGNFMTIGKLLLYYSGSIGLMGVTTAIDSLTGPLFAVIQCVKDKQWISIVEGISLILCVIGALIIASPEVVLRPFTILSKDNKQQDNFAQKKQCEDNQDEETQLSLIPKQQD